jgi:PAS domain S-box-containing protein
MPRSDRSGIVEAFDTILLVGASAELVAELAPLGRQLARRGAHDALARVDIDIAVVVVDLAAISDALEVLAPLRQYARGLDIPLVFLGGAGMSPAEVLHAYACGAIDVLLRPYDPAILCAKLDVLLALYRRRIASELASAPTSPAATRAPTGVREDAEHRYRFLAESIPQQVWTARPDGSLDYINALVCDYSGLPAAVVLGSGWVDLLHPEDVTEAVARWSRSLETGDDYDIEFRLRRRDGAYRWHLGRAVAQRDETGRVLRWFGTNTDIDDQKTMESELRASQAALRDSARRFRVLAEAMPLIVWSMSPDGEDAYLNPQWLEYTGQGEAISLADRWRLALHPDDYASCFETWAAAGATKALWQLEYRLRRRDGVYRWHLGRSVPDLDTDGEVIRWYGTATDIHEQRTAIESREQLLATVSHDLRDPLGTIALANATLREAAEGDPVVEHVTQTIERSVGRMEQLLGDLLDLATIESGHLSIERATHDAGAMLEEARDAISARAAGKGIAIAVTHPAAPSSVDCDRRRVLQVLSNLLGNAVKFTPNHGTITVSARRDADQVVFSVSDTGIGIAAEQLPHVFDRYWKSRDRAKGGTGLGLAISRGIVEQHGGSLAVDSRPGAGSTFSFTLPIA